MGIADFPRIKCTTGPNESGYKGENNRCAILLNFRTPEKSATDKSRRNEMQKGGKNEKGSQGVT